MIRARLAVLNLVTLAVLCSRPAGAQDAGMPRDSVALDTALVDSTRGDSARRPMRSTPRHPNHFRLLAIGAVAILAPAGLAFRPAPDSAATAIVDDYVAAYVSAGYAESDRRGWAHAQSVEALWKGLYGQAELESYRLQHETVLRSVRVGYLHRNGGSAAGGLTLGYRNMNGVGIPEGVEIGLPFIWQAPAGWVHVDARYVLYDRTATWNWRLEIRLPLSRKPLVVGFGMDFKPQRDEDDDTFARASVLIGVLR